MTASWTIVVAWWIIALSVVSLLALVCVYLNDYGRIVRQLLVNSANILAELRKLNGVMNGRNQ